MKSVEERKQERERKREKERRQVEELKQELEEYVSRLYEVFDGVSDGKMLRIVGVFLNERIRQNNSSASELFVSVKFSLTFLEYALKARLEDRHTVVDNQRMPGRDCG